MSIRLFNQHSLKRLTMPVLGRASQGQAVKQANSLRQLIDDAVELLTSVARVVSTLGHTDTASDVGHAVQSLHSMPSAKVVAPLSIDKIEPCRIFADDSRKNDFVSVADVAQHCPTP